MKREDLFEKKSFKLDAAHQFCSNDHGSCDRNTYSQIGFGDIFIAQSAAHCYLSQAAGSEEVGDTPAYYGVIFIRYIWDGLRSYTIGN